MVYYVDEHVIASDTFQEKREKRKGKKEHKGEKIKGRRKKNKLTSQPLTPSHHHSPWRRKAVSAEIMALSPFPFPLPPFLILLFFSSWHPPNLSPFSGVEAHIWYMIVYSAYCLVEHCI